MLQADLIGQISVRGANRDQVSLELVWHCLGKKGDFSQNWTFKNSTTWTKPETFLILKCAGKVENLNSYHL